MGAQADPEVYHWSSRSVTGSAECREASSCHHVASRTLVDNRVLSGTIVMCHPGVFDNRKGLSPTLMLVANCQTERDSELLTLEFKLDF